MTVEEALRILRSNPNPPRSEGYFDIPLLDWDLAENVVFRHVMAWVCVEYPHNRWLRLSHGGWWHVGVHHFHIFGERGPLLVHMAEEGGLWVEETYLNAPFKRRE